MSFDWEAFAVAAWIIAIHDQSFWEGLFRAQDQRWPAWLALRGLSHDYLFHPLLGVLGVDASAYQSEKDTFALANDANKCALPLPRPTKAYTF